MKMNVKGLIGLFKFLKIFAPIMATIYLLIWVIQIFIDSLFIFLNKIFGLLPFLIEKIVYVPADMAGKDISMSYVHASCIMLIVMFISQKVLVRLEKINKIQENKELERRFNAQRELKKKKEEKKQEIVLKRNVFFGLFEFKLDYFDYFGSYKSESQELKKLKIEYCKMIMYKLKIKYPKIKFISADKLYFICADFSVFSGVTRDIVKLFRVLLNIGNEKGIKTEMLLSYWAGDKNSNAKGTYNILSKINELNYINQVVVASGVYFRYKDEHEKNEIEFNPLGASKLVNAISSGEDLDITLYLTKKLFNTPFS